jgi:selenocysteine-specific elongation factor
LVNGDHYVIRSPMDTIGGGKVVDSRTKRLRRFRSGVIESLEVKQEGSSEDVILTQLEAGQPMEPAALLAKTELASDQAAEALESLVREGRIVRVEQGEQSILFTVPGWRKLGEQAYSVLDEYHRKFPTRTGMPKAELGSRLKLGKFAPGAWPRLASEGVLTEENLAVRLPSWQVKLTPAQQKSIDDFLKGLADNPYSPSPDRIPAPDLLNLLLEQGKVVRLADGIVFSVTAYNNMVEKVTSQIQKQGKTTLAEVRDMLQTSRKYVQALLEHLDEKKITRRVGDERILY